MKNIIKRCITLILCLQLLIMSTGCGAQPDSAIGVVKKYWHVKRWEDRLQYVKYPDRVEPLMAEYYKNTTFPLTEYVTFEVSNSDDELTLILVKKSGSSAFPYFVVKTPEGYKIDWEASLPYNPMSWAEFKATKPTSPIRCRVAATLGDYYNYEFRGMEDLFWSVTLMGINYDNSDGLEWISLTGFIKKDSADGEALFELLKDGEQHGVILDLMYPENADSSSDCVLIDSFVNDTILSK